MSRKDGTMNYKDYQKMFEKEKKKVQIASAKEDIPANPIRKSRVLPEYIQEAINETLGQ